MSELPKNFIDEFLDLKRRVSTIERATRVPQVSGLGTQGPKFAQYQNFFDLTNPAGEATTNGDAVRLTVAPPVTGSIVVMCGSFLQGGGSGVSDYATASVEMLHDGVPFYDIHGGAVSVSEYASTGRTLTNAARMYSPYGSDPIDLRLNFVKQPGVYTARFSDPWILVLPI